MSDHREPEAVQALEGGSVTPSEHDDRSVWWRIAGINILQAVNEVARQARSEGYADAISLAAQAARAAGASDAVLGALAALPCAEPADPDVVTMDVPPETA
jgi:hypothetical protein